jgi:hypothetical protein
MGKGTFTLTVDDMKAVCAVGEMAGKKMIDEKKIPVISCEGACIRGEIARLAAHLVAKEEPYSGAATGRCSRRRTRPLRSGCAKPKRSSSSTDAS